MSDRNTTQTKAYYYERRRRQGENHGDLSLTSLQVGSFRRPICSVGLDIPPAGEICRADLHQIIAEVLNILDDDEW